MQRQLTAGTLAAFVLCGAGQAYAHAHLIGADPGVHAAVAAPVDLLKLDFSEGLQLGFSGVTVHRPDGAIVPTEDAHLAPGDDKEMRVPFTRTLRPGQYTVEWHALSTDGHATRGSYEFRVTD